MTNHKWTAKGLSKADIKALDKAFYDTQFDSQCENVANFLGVQGFVSNFAALDANGPFSLRGRMLRLGAIIFRLRRNYGMNIVTARGFEMANCPPHLHKNTYYLIGEKAKKFKKGQEYDMTLLEYHAR